MKIRGAKAPRIPRVLLAYQSLSQPHPQLSQPHPQLSQQLLQPQLLQPQLLQPQFQLLFQLLLQQQQSKMIIKMIH